MVLPNLLPSAFPIRKCRRVLSSYTRPSVRLSGLATGYLWRTVSVQRSLIASLVTCRNFPTSDDDKSRQNCQIRREIRKKNFRDNFFSDGNLSVSVSFNFFPLAFFLTICLTLYVPRDIWPRLDQWDRRCDTWCADTLRSEAAILLLCLREVVAYYIFSTGLCNCLRMDIFQILEYWWKIYGEWNVLVLSCLARAVCSQIRSKIWSRTCCEQAAIFLFFYELASLLFWVWS